MATSSPPSMPEVERREPAARAQPWLSLVGVGADGAPSLTPAAKRAIARAEPIAALYAQGRVKHAGTGFALLEDQMCAFGLDGLAGGGSPDRLDAMVWAVTELTDRAWQGPRIRFL